MSRKKYLKDWHEKHLEIHNNFPEKFRPEGGGNAGDETAQAPPTLPIYFGNVCLR